MLSLDEARQVIAQSLSMLPAEHAPLLNAQNRFLRSPLVAAEDMPPFDRSAFDGYALPAQDAPAPLRVAFEIPAGHPAPRALQRGECARIFTGGTIPAGADAVAMQEVCTRKDDLVEIPAIASGSGVRRRGEDAPAGTMLLESGCRLGPVELALLAQLGKVDPLVAPRPRVFHVRTGSEIVAPDAEPRPGQIRDSNSTLIRALVAEAGCELVGSATAGDDLPELLTACAGAGDAHLLLISGGASVGDYDFGRAALTELGYSVRFSSLNLRPGKPLIFATRGRQCAFVIPGNPLSHFVCWHVVIRAAVDALVHGMSTLGLEEFTLGGAKPLPGNPRETWWPARLAFRGGAALAEPMKWQSSGDLTGLSGVRLLLRIPSNASSIPPGATIQALAL